MNVHFDCFSGISGDMTLGALMDLGVPVEWLREKLQSVLPASEFELGSETVSKKGIRAVSARVIPKPGAPERDYRAIRDLITAAPLSEAVRQNSMAIFDVIAEAEGKIHQCPKDHVHFHELGCVDSLVDVVGVALGLEYLGVQSISVSEIPLGSGFVDCEHGRLPVPAPATLEILKGVPVRGDATPCELVTPTGAAIVKALGRAFGQMPAMTVAALGYGAGKRELEERPNVLRVVLGKPAQGRGEENVVMLETGIDDMNPEIFGHLMETLFADGALDVYWVPIYMKKNRPGTLVQVLCRPADQNRLSERLFKETTSTGIRFNPMQRRILPRSAVTVETRFGSIQAKRIELPDGGVRIVPEYEVCRRIAGEHGLPLQAVYDQVNRDAEDAASPDMPTGQE